MNLVNYLPTGSKKTFAQKWNEKWWLFPQNDSFIGLAYIRIGRFSKKYFEHLFLDLFYSQDTWLCIWSTHQLAIFHRLTVTFINQEPAFLISMGNTSARYQPGVQWRMMRSCPEPHQSSTTLRSSLFTSRTLLPSPISEWSTGRTT